jgi:hypothetical protein
LNIYDEENLKGFRQEYEQMPIHEKAMENRPLVVGSVLTGLLVIFVLVPTTGIAWYFLDTEEMQF